MDMDKNVLAKYIAVGVALMVFIPLFFGRFFFPSFTWSIFPSLGIFQAGIFGGGEEVIADQKERLVDIAGLAGSDAVTILDLELGDGATAAFSNTVRVGYVGAYVDQETNEEIVFDQNLDRENAFSFVLGSGMVIPGFDVGVTGMREGGKRLVIIKPEMGYGSQPYNDIPANTTLHFMIELYEVQQ